MNFPSVPVLLMFMNIYESHLLYKDSNNKIYRINVFEVLFHGEPADPTEKPYTMDRVDDELYSGQVPNLPGLWEK